MPPNSLPSAGATGGSEMQMTPAIEVATGPPPQQYRVAMLGASGVGKSALTSQFLSSDHMNTYDNVGKYIHGVVLIDL